jgi:beta-N-acetylhexosaminidase
MKNIYLLGLFIQIWSCTSTPKNKIVIIEPNIQNYEETVRTGLDVLLEDYPDYLKGKTIGLVTNHTGISRKGEKNYKLFENNPDITLKRIFAPEHGFYGEASTGAKVEYDNQKGSGPEIISLYGNTRKPTTEMLEGIDLVIYDIQDVGARFYTYISTLGIVMEAAGENGVNVMVLDRPNPLGGEIIEGAILDTAFKSFIGYFPIPARYALTVGELSQMAVKEGWLSSVPPELIVVTMDDWKRSMFFDDTDLPWIPPSPNIPDLETAMIYPGICLYEATNVSEGIGTNKPFKQIGAPWMNYDIAKEMKIQGLKGVDFKYAKFKPKNLPGRSENPKFAGYFCVGQKIVITDKNEFRSVDTAIYSLMITIMFYMDNFRYDAKRIGYLWGNNLMNRFLRGNLKPKTLFKLLNQDQEKFIIQSAPYYLYQ